MDIKTKITLVIHGKEFELTKDEANELFNLLKKELGYDTKPIDLGGLIPRRDPWIIKDSMPYYSQPLVSCTNGTDKITLDGPQWPLDSQVTSGFSQVIEK